MSLQEASMSANPEQDFMVAAEMLDVTEESLAALEDSGGWGVDSDSSHQCGLQSSVWTPAISVDSSHQCGLQSSWVKLPLRIAGSGWNLAHSLARH